MSRLISLLTLLLLLLVAVQPASGVVRVSEENRAPEFFAEEAARVWEMPSPNQDRTRDTAVYGYEFASDVCEGPNLYAYVGNGPIGASDPLGLAALGNPNYAVALGILEWGMGGGAALISEKALESIGSSVALLEAGATCMMDSVPSPTITPEEFGWSMLSYGAGQGLAKVAGPMISRALGKAAGRGYQSFNAFKRAEGAAGLGKAWHHIVEQTPGNVRKFGAQVIHNTDNLVKLPHGSGTIHSQISGYYSSKQPFTGGQTVRQWLSSQSFEEQAAFGRNVMQQFGGTP